MGQRQLGGALLLSFVVIATLTACTAGNTTTAGVTPTALAGTVASEGPSASARPPATEDARTASFCTTNAAAARAVHGTVADDIDARRAQADAARMLLPLPGAAPEVSAGAKKFIAAGEETIRLLRTFPPTSKVADIGTDPRFLQSTAVRAAATDPEYRAFLGWVLRTCSSTP